MMKNELYRRKEEYDYIEYTGTGLSPHLAEVFISAMQRTGTNMRVLRCGSNIVVTNDPDVELGKMGLFSTIQETNG